MMIILVFKKKKNTFEHTFPVVAKNGKSEGIERSFIQQLFHGKPVLDMRW